MANLQFKLLHEFPLKIPSRHHSSNCIHAYSLESSDKSKKRTKVINRSTNFCDSQTTLFLWLNLFVCTGTCNRKAILRHNSNVGQWTGKTQLGQES